MIDTNKELVTMEGDEVRIYATDGQGDFPVHGAILGDNGWILSMWSKDGDNPSVCEYNLVEKWEPKRNELCWFYDVLPPHCATLMRFKEMSLDGKYIDEIGVSWAYCSEFIGELPPHLKDTEFKDEMLAGETDD